MTAKEIDSVLETFEIVVDTREQNTPRSRKRFRSFGVPYTRATLDYGDYCGQVTLPNGEKINAPKEDGRIHPICSVERKMDLDELAGNITNGRKRFEREFKRAADSGARVFLLVENASIDMIIRHDYKSRINANSFFGTIIAWMVRGFFIPIFCPAERSGMIIADILRKDIKERLMKGEYG